MTKEKNYRDNILPPGSLLPLEPVMGAGRIERFGAIKYEPEGWKDGYSVEDHLIKCISHSQEYMDGIRSDHESFESPLYHALCRLMYAIWLMENGEVNGRI